MKALPPNPFAGDTRKLQGLNNIWRRRVGAYRIFYEIEKTRRLVHIFKVERRGSNTY